MRIDAVVAAKDLIIAGKDLQMVRSRQMQIPESTSSVGAPLSSSAANPIVLVVECLRRQWPLLMLAAITSGAFAFLCSWHFSTESVTAHLQLRSRSLPLTGPEFYLVPTTEAASNLVQSSRVLQPVVENLGLPSVAFVNNSMIVTSDARTGTVMIDLRLQDKSKVNSILEEIGDSLTQTILQDRRDSLDTHSQYVRQLQLEAEAQLETARNDLVRETILALSDPETQTRQNAELPGLLTQKTQLEASIQGAIRRMARVDRDLEINRLRETEILAMAASAVLEGRQSQIEAFGQGLTSATRRFTQKQELMAELAVVKQSVTEALAARLADVPGDVASPPSDTVGSVEGTALLRQTTMATFASWIARIQSVGRDVIGNFDPQTQEAASEAQRQLVNLETTRLERDLQRSDLAVDLEYYNKSLAETQSLLRQPRQSNGGSISAVVMQMESNVNQREQQCAHLAQQVNRINQIRNCAITEYFVSSPATFDAESDVKSKRFKLFLLALLGSGFFFVSPVIILEWLRWRPSPVNVLSRRWNLPALGLQTLSQAGRGNAKLAVTESQNAIRLMALRIQQSLIQPTGRVVLFSGLDHEDSPIALIRDLAECLSRREEKVLIMQTRPCELEQAVAPGNDGERRGRPGVAELVAGEFDDAEKLVAETGIYGIDFLPGGCAPSSSEAMASSRLTALIDQLRERYTIILMSGPSTLNPADLQMLAARADGIVFTVNKQSLRDIYGSEVLSDLVELGAPVLGFAEQPPRGKIAFRSPEAVDQKNVPQTPVA